MNDQHPWNFEPCENEGPICDPAGLPWAHAVRGRKPQRPAVMGYGHTPNAADADARTKATQYDAREMLGERGELVTNTLYITPPIGWEIIDPDGMTIKAKLGGDILQSWKIAIVKAVE